MIFDKQKNGAKELRCITGNYYANNDFNKIVGEIDRATDELAALVGNGVISLAERYYQQDDDESDTELVKKVQRPIAILATLRMYQKNDLSHEDDGRKFKISTDNGEKLPWEWQLDRDDALHLEEYYRDVDALIRYLNAKSLKEWTDTDVCKLSQQLIIRSGSEFDLYFPIDKSERIFLMLVPFIREAQRLTVKRAYGTGWDSLLEEKEIPASDARYAACMATALLAMSTALRRLPLRVFPYGVVCGYMAKNGMGDSRPADLEDVVRVAEWMADDARTWIDEMKRARDGEHREYELLPSNNKNNKFCNL